MSTEDATPVSETIADVEATMRRLDGIGDSGAAVQDAVSTEHLLAALAALHAAQDQLAAWEPLLIGAAREQGASWAAIAPALGVASRQAAERRYLRLNQQASDPAGMTGEQRVQAARDRRAGQRAVTQWANANAGRLRQLAGQITGLPGLSSAAQAAVDQVGHALGNNDTATLLDPLAKAEPHLQPDHPDLANQIAAVARTTAQLRRDPTADPH
ncbi:hypothetical protein [Kribbella sp. HUAS MG21]|uniref:HSP18 transcriptional regulator n=1 Tax=Kribbella sp. HUAS MG21 TaxID=3160966 RepID=A0AAU7T684_9ACTN